MWAMPVATFFLTFFLPTFFTISLLLHRRLLLAGDGLARALAGARVGVGALAAHGQAAAVAEPPVAADVHEQLDVLRHLAAEVALHLVVALDHLANPYGLALAELVGSGVGRDVRLLADLARTGAPDSEDIGQRNLDALVPGEIDSGDTRHRAPLPPSP